MLIAEPAAVIDQPRSTSSVGPKLKIIVKPMLKTPQIRPAMIRAKRVLRSSREAAEGAAAAIDPRVLTVPVGASVVFPNADPILHNVFSISEGNKFESSASTARARARELGVQEPGSGTRVLQRPPLDGGLHLGSRHALLCHAGRAMATSRSPACPRAPGRSRCGTSKPTAASSRSGAARRGGDGEARSTKPRVPSHLNKTGQSYNQRGDSY